MHDEIAVIGQDPLGILIAFDAERQFPEFGKFLAHRVRDGLDLPLVGSGADDEVIGEGSYFLEIQDADIGSFLGFSGAHGAQPERGDGGILSQGYPPLS